jgi:hypothetical protein
MKRICIFLFVLAISVLTATANAQVTSLSLTGEPGDFVLGNQSKFLTPADGTFNVSENFDNGVSLFFSGNQLGEFWLVDFAAPNNQLLTVGTYTGATRFPFQAFSEPGLSIAGDGAGCNTLTGNFTVLEINYGPGGSIISFDATFEQHCEGVAAALRGELRFNAHPTVSLTAPSHLTVIENNNVNFTVTATDAQSRHVVLSATGLPAGATFVDNGNNTGTFNWTPTSVQTGNFFVTFRGDNLSGDTGVAVTQISVILPPPPNDDFNSPTVIPSMPFTVSQNVTNATTAPDDPFCVGRTQTVWFSFTPSQNMRLEANTFGSNYDTTLSVYTGARGALTQLACNDDSNGSVQSRVRFDAVAGTTYFFMVSSFSFFPVSAANLTFNLVPAPPALAITPSVTQFGAVDPSTGAATISGFVSCTQPAFVTISGQLKQSHGGTPLSGFFSAFVPCNGTTPWSATIQTTVSLFHGRSVDLFTGGKADVTATASAFDFENGVFVQRNLAVTIILRGKP